MVAFVQIESATSCHLNKHRLNRICTNIKQVVKGENRAKRCKCQTKKSVAFSFKFPILPRCSLLLWDMENAPYFCRQKRAMERRTGKGITNKTIIELWDTLSLRTQTRQGWGMRYSALPRPATRHSGNRAGIRTGCTTVMCAGCLISASVPCSTTVTRVCCHSPK